MLIAIYWQFQWKSLLLLSDPNRLQGNTSKWLRTEYTQVLPLSWQPRLWCLIMCNLFGVWSCASWLFPKLSSLLGSFQQLLDGNRFAQVCSACMNWIVDSLSLTLSCPLMHTCESRQTTFMCKSHTWCCVERCHQQLYMTESSDLQFLFFYLQWHGPSISGLRQGPEAGDLCEFQFGLM